MTRFAWLSAYFYKIFKNVCKFLATVPGSLKYHLNSEELARITITALSAGSGFYGILQAVMQQLPAVFPAPTDGAIAAVILTTIFESRRRLSQGVELVPRERPRHTRPSS